MSAVSFGHSRVVPSKGTLLWGALLINTEALLLLGYLLVSDSQLLNLAALRLYGYPFVWINVSLWALVRVRPPTAPRRRQLLAGTLAAGYFLVLAFLGGLVSLAGSGGVSVSITALSLPPGWGPALSIDAFGVLVTLLPFKTIGYITLSYLVYTTVVEAAGMLPAVLGLFSCVSCVWAAVVLPLTGAIGGTSAIAGFVYAGGYDLSTAIFVLAVALLAWRPSVSSLNRIGFPGGRK
ncbi:hypothetical protein Hrd1104_08255 [Halorhabdus sp. CBA1104]|uniref:DUF7546 family protein n=1 Tax=Halorhabdus sp. CBA1104 TaxID=1380432 RepID=UPI0012B1CE8F|nr:hypothetical protein [Halorhabdus sp. CBA1104]QGN07297.1 hypothetical protein Hrd1104_08255 [Halorhabdus sp. CBA1104]